MFKVEKLSKKRNFSTENKNNFKRSKRRLTPNDCREIYNDLLRLEVNNYCQDFFLFVNNFIKKYYDKSVNIINLDFILTTNFNEEFLIKKQYIKVENTELFQTSS